MRAFQRLSALTAAVASAGLLVAGAGGVASASARHAPPTVRLTGGLTTVTTSPGIAAALVSNGIVPLATAPAQQWLTLKPGLAAHLSFPVTGGRVSLHPVGGFVTHIGGILFLDEKTGKQVEVSNFTLSLTPGAASALDAALGTTVFTAGLGVGTAATLLRF